MNKLVKVTLLTAVLAVSSSVYAYNDQQFQGDKEKLCFSSEEIVKEVVKETINVVGQHLLDKYLKGNGIQELRNNIESQQNNSDNTNTTNNNSTTSNTNQNQTSTQDTTASSAAEEETNTTNQANASSDSDGDGDLIILD